MKKRLIRADVSQLQPVAPFNSDDDKFKQHPSDIYTNYGNIAWVTSTEAQKIIDVFGNQYILEGSEPSKFYVNPKYLDSEVEALIWRLRGTTPIESSSPDGDKGTYAAGKFRTTIKKEDGEYIVRLYDDNGKMISDYFTDDKGDAEGTAEMMKKEYLDGKRAQVSGKRLLKAKR